MTLLQPGNAGVQDPRAARGARRRSAGRRSAAGISARCWRCCSCARTSRSRPSVSSTSSGASIRRGRRRRRSRTPSSQLRKLLGPGLLLTRPTGYVLELDADQLDLTRFERLVREARGGRGRRARPSSYAKRSRLWRGSPLADLESETFAQSDIQRLEDLRLGVLEERIAADLESRRRRRARGGDRGARPGAPAARAAARAADARALPVRSAGRGARGVTTTRAGRWSRSWGSSRGRSCRLSTARSSARSARCVRVAQPALEDHYDEVMRAFCAGRLVPVLGPGVGGVAGHELATLLADSLRARRRRSRACVRLAGRRGTERDRPSARRAAPRARRGTSSPRSCTAGLPACRRCSGTARCRSS